MRVWHLDRFGSRPLTVNKVRTMHRMAWANYVKDERATWERLASGKNIPTLERACIVVTPLHKDRRSPQDVAACAPAVKAAIDGIVDAGVLPDDDPEHLLEVVFRPPWICGADGMRLTVEEAP